MLYRNILRLLIGVISITSILLTILVIISLFILSSEKGRVAFLRNTAEIISKYSEYKISVNNAHSSTINIWSIDDISVTYKDKEIVFVKDFNLDLSLPELLNSKVIANNISANIVKFAYFPDNTPKKKIEPHNFKMPKLLPIEIKSFSVGKLNIQHPAFPEGQIYALGGSINYSEKNPLPLIDLNIATLVGVPLKISIDSAHLQNGKTQIRGTLTEDAGGLVGLLIKHSEPGKANNLQLDLDSVISLAAANQLAIDKFNLTSNYRGKPLSLKSSALISANSVTINPSLMQFDNSSLSIKGYIKKKQLNFMLELAKFPLSVAQPWIGSNINGTVDANLNVKGDISSPFIDGNMDINGSYTNNAAAETTIKSDLNFTGKLDSPEAKANINLSTNATERDGNKKIQRQILTTALIEIKNKTLEGNIKLSEAGKERGKLAFSIPWLNIANLNNKIDGKIFADIDMDLVSLILGGTANRAKGILSADTKLGGTFSSPELYGDISIKNGLYQNQISGTNLQDIQAKIKASGKSISIDKATATDGKNGTIELSGSTAWEQHEIKNISANLSVREANLLRRYDMDGVATGKVTLNGSGKEMTLAGKLEVSPFTLFLDTLMHEGIANVEVKEIYQNNTAENSYKSHFIESMPTINMDVTLTANNKAFLRGKGVDAELSGEVGITGTLLKSIYKGKFTVVRGKYEILGKSFKLVEGTIQFVDDVFNLNVKGENKTKDADIFAVLSGGIDTLSITLSSEPVMPQDEIISALLFGKSSRNISPFQAISLANAVRTMKQGGKAMFDPLDFTKKITGVDFLSVGTDSTESGPGVSVGVGKYIGDKVYVEVEKGSSPTQPFKANIEAEITPNISVETSTSTGTTSSGGVELKWKKDY